MEFRNVNAGYDLETGLYFVCDSELKFVSAEARSLSALRRKLAPLELHPVLSAIYAKDAPELRKGSNAPEPRIQDRGGGRDGLTEAK